MAKTEEIRQLLRVHHNPASGMFGLLNTTLSTNADRDSLNQTSSSLTLQRPS